jgi:hypothetical protein
LKKIIYLAIIVIVLLAFYPDILADLPGGSFLSGIGHSVHSFFANILAVSSSLLHKLLDSFSMVTDIFKSPSNESL